MIDFAQKCQKAYQNVYVGEQFHLISENAGFVKTDNIKALGGCWWGACKFLRQIGAGAVYFFKRVMFALDTLQSFQKQNSTIQIAFAIEPPETAESPPNRRMWPRLDPDTQFFGGKTSGPQQLYEREQT
jgi:hypothetical protein